MRDVVEGLIRQVWREVKGMELEEFRVMPYEVAMDVVCWPVPDQHLGEQADKIVWL